VQQNGSPMILSRSRTFYTNSEMKPNSQNKSFEYKGYKNNFQQMKYTQQKDTPQVIVNTFMNTIYLSLIFK